MKKKKTYAGDCRRKEVRIPVHLKAVNLVTEQAITTWNCSLTGLEVKSKNNSLKINDQFYLKIWINKNTAINLMVICKEERQKEETTYRLEILTSSNSRWVNFISSEIELCEEQLPKAA